MAQEILKVGRSRSLISINKDKKLNKEEKNIELDKELLHMCFLIQLRKLIPYPLLYRIYVRSLTEETADALNTREGFKAFNFKESDYRIWINELALDLANRLDSIKHIIKKD